MSEEILIDVNDFETRVAVLADGELCELHLERGGNYSLTGNLYQGKVQRVVPGVQAAFVDIGLDRPGFLHVRDVHGFRTDAEPRDITALVAAGQQLLVQVAKDPLNGKGARLTTNLAVATRHVVLLPMDSNVGVSTRIVEEDERQRLKGLAESVRDELGQSYGCIVRTAGRVATRDQLGADLVVLERLWRRIEARRSSRETRGLVFEELPVPMRIVRDMAGPSVEAIMVNDTDMFERLVDYVGRHLPEYSDRVVHYDGRTPLFDAHDLEPAIERALDPRVSLPSGGHLVIEQTEAMTTIDVNSGAYVDSANLEDTAYRINLEAARVLPRELRLRNIGGIVVVDFIDMTEADHRDGVVAALVDAAQGDPARFHASGFSELGLVEISRRRTRESLLHQMCEPCGRCAGHGRARSPQSACYDIFRAVERQDRNGTDSSVTEYLVCAGQEVVDRLLGEDADHLSDLTRTVGRPIRVQVEPGYCTDQFDVVPR